MAKFAEGEQRGKATLSWPTWIPGIVLERQLDTMVSSFTGGHWVCASTSCSCESGVLGGRAGLPQRQVRLARRASPMCMRWLGPAVRANDIARAYAAKRQAFANAWRARGRGLHLAATT